MGLKPRPEYTPRISVVSRSSHAGWACCCDVTYHKPDEVHLRELFHCGVFHFGPVTSFELLTSVTDLSRIFGLDDLKRATTAHPKGQTR